MTEAEGGLWMQEEEDNIQPVGRKHLPIEVHKQIVRKVSLFSNLATQSVSQDVTVVGAR